MNARAENSLHANIASIASDNQDRVPEPERT